MVLVPEYYLATRFRVALTDAEWPEEFSIITAFATTGETWTDGENQRADEVLEMELRTLDSNSIRITGYSPTTGHAEDGWAVKLPWQEACDLGLKYKQDAIYHVKGDELFISFCDERRELVKVASFRERLGVSVRV